LKEHLICEKTGLIIITAQSLLCTQKRPNHSFMLKILSWNILQGGGSRTHGILRFVAQQGAHILVFSEFRNNENGAFLRNKLLEAKYLFQAVSCTDAETNSVLIASKLPCDFRLFLHTGLEFSHSVIAADFDAFHLYGVYLPHKKKHQLFPLLQKELLEHRPALLMGDFNTGKNFIDQKGDSFWYTEALTKLEQEGSHDAFRYVQGDATAFSWYSHQGNGYRYDHIWASIELLPAIKNCDYVHQARIDKLSDHSPMVLSF
jgi:exodeoxyribonuclease III